MEPTYRIYPNVTLGQNVQIGDFVIVGHPPRGAQPGELPTVIGDNAVLRSHTVIYAGTTIGNNFQTGHGVIVREQVEIGDDVSIGSYSTIEHCIKIGDNVRFHGLNVIGEFTTIEEGCWIGPHVSVTNVPHPRCPVNKKCIKGATIRRHAKVCANATLLPTVEIGEYALVGAGAVVAADVPRGAVVVGNPARVVKDVMALQCPYGLIERPYEVEYSE
jgi:acetyltransferase-like isoleucine patch superfamily enzyme